MASRCKGQAYRRGHVKSKVSKKIIIKKFLYLKGMLRSNEKQASPFFPFFYKKINFADLKKNFTDVIFGSYKSHIYCGGPMKSKCVHLR